MEEETPKMDAATYTAYLQNRHRAAELERENAQLSSQSERRAAQGGLAPQPLRLGLLRRLTLRRRATLRRTSAGLALAGPSS